jgi:hypothetical protein
MRQADFRVEVAAAELAAVEVVLGAGQAVCEAVLVDVVPDRAKPTHPRTLAMLEVNEQRGNIPVRPVDRAQSQSKAISLRLEKIR